MMQAGSVSRILTLTRAAMRHDIDAVWISRGD
jgi:hypothetical protein